MRLWPQSSWFYESVFVLLDVSPQSWWLLRNTRLEWFHTLERYGFELRGFIFHFLFCSGVQPLLHYFNVSPWKFQPTHILHNFTIWANKKNTMERVIICSSPSVTMYHLRPASSTARCCRHFSHLLFNSDLMKRPQPLTNNTSRCLPLVPPRVAQNPSPKVETK